MTAIYDLRDEYKTLVADIALFQKQPPKYELFIKQLPSIERSINSFEIHFQKDVIAYNILETAAVALPFIAADLPQEEHVDENDLSRIRKLASELQNSVESTESLPAVVRQWLLDLIRIIRDSVIVSPFVAVVACAVSSLHF